MTNIKLVLQDDNLPGARKCGGCTLCCKLLPVHDGILIDGKRQRGNLDKLAGERCPHQRFKKGCAVYNTSKMPSCCKVWNCRWLTGDDTADLSRPDHSHVVLDLMPDFITLVDNETGEKRNVEVVQVWCDPHHPEAWRAPSLLSYFERRGQQGIAALIRYNSNDAFTLFPPSMSGDHQWHEARNGTVVPERSPADFIKMIEGGTPP